MTRRPDSRPFRLLVRLAVTLSACAALAVAPIGPAGLAMASSATPAPSVPTGLPAGIEGLSSYVPANSCSPSTKPGTAKLGKLLTSTYPGTSFGGARACGLLPNSEHHDGRAVDWMNSVRNAKQAAQAKAVIDWLLATDAQGHTYANARRLGVMYVIWNNKIWGAYSADRGWRDYNDCANHKATSWDSACHRNHMHLSLSWAGAMGHTSFWTNNVAAPDYGRCRPADLNWSYNYDGFNSTPCRRYAVVKPPKGASAALTTLTKYSGRYLKKGYQSGAVTAVQKAIGTKASGTYTATTVAAVKKWQSAHDVQATGTINHPTWRALLKANAPK